MLIQQNISLLPYNTFGIDAIAERFAELTDTDQLHGLSTLPYVKRTLGGGSNILLTKPVDGLVVQNKLKGITVLKEDDVHVWLEVQSGEIWHELVMHAIANGWCGIENLALIPGTVGAAPIQNIGAYGVEAKETIELVNAWKWEDKCFVSYTNEECQFGYRDSIFKHQQKDKSIITSVVFRLNKQPNYKTSYGAIAQELERMNVTELSIKAIADAVISIRTSKLPDPKQIGNAGSFFKNPTVDKAVYDHLKIKHPDVPSYPAPDDMIKIPAGWLIEQGGWKGFRNGDVGVHAKQALVLVNYGQAKGADVWQLSGEVVQSVKDKFGIELEREVQVW